MIRTMRGQIGGLETKQIVVDDGNINRAYKVKEFRVFPTSVAGSRDVEATLALDYDAGASWNASDNRQIGWAAMTTTNTTRIMEFSIIDPDHVVVRDLYVKTNTADPGNYLIVLEAISISDDEAVLQILKERSQDDIR